MPKLWLESTQEVGFTPTHIDAVSAATDPPILAATIISAILLIAATQVWLASWFRPANNEFSKAFFCLWLAR